MLLFWAPQPVQSKRYKIAVGSHFVCFSVTPINNVNNLAFLQEAFLTVKLHVLVLLERDSSSSRRLPLHVSWLNFPICALLKVKVISPSLSEMYPTPEKFNKPHFSCEFCRRRCRNIGRTSNWLYVQSKTLAFHELPNDYDLSSENLLPTELLPLAMAKNKDGLWFHI